MTDPPERRRRNDDSGAPARGGSFYDAPGVFETYRGRRRKGTSSLNVVMEKPAVLAELGSLAGERVLGSANSLAFCEVTDFAERAFFRRTGGGAS